MNGIYLNFNYYCIAIKFFNMNYYIVIGLLVVCSTQSVLSLSDEIKELMAQLRQTCVGETGVDPALIDKANNEKVIEDDEKLKCYMKCILDQMACIGDDGVIDIEAVVGMLPDEMKADAEPVIRKCGSKVGANACENVWLTQKCHLAERPDIFIMV